MEYYLGIDGEAPMVSWYEASPRFYVSEVSALVAALVKEKLQRSRCVYLGSYQGCGCGFRSSQDGVASVPLDDQEETLTQNDHSLLAAYLRQLPMTATPIRIFAAWSGDEGRSILHMRECAISELESPRFAFRERELITVLRDGRSGVFG